jgi:predicted O-methyltransferase YrrM
MLDDSGAQAVPHVWSEIERRTAELGFDMPSDMRAGALLKALAASKPHGRLLELGTGTGLATACLLAGMDSASRLVSVDIDVRVQAVARDLLGSDSRVSFELADGREFIHTQHQQSYDLVFADAWAGKYDGLDDALTLVRHGGFFIGDDMLPQANWPDNHQERAERLVTYLGGTARLDDGDAFLGVRVRDLRSVLNHR